MASNRNIRAAEASEGGVTYASLPQPVKQHQERRPTFPFEHTTRHKPRRWPLALRFIKGSVHNAIIVPVILHAVFASIVVALDLQTRFQFGLPSSIIPSLSIVVGLMLVFRNQTAYARFWDGRRHLSTVITCCRNLTRCFLTTSYASGKTPQQPPTLTRQRERADTERTVRYLLALLISTKNHLRGNWGGFAGLSSSRAPSPNRYSWATQVASDPSQSTTPDSFLHERDRWRRRRAGRVAELADLVPGGLMGYEDRGLGVPLQFAALVEGYIKRGYERDWWNAPTSSQHTAQLNTLMDAYGNMETIRLTPVPVAILIHQKQVLALFGAVLPFAMVNDLGWWAIPISTLVVFTLYGIDGIATQLEEPFGFDRADIDMDPLVEDIRTEILVLLDEWQRVGEAEGEVLPPVSKSYRKGFGSVDSLVDVSDGVMKDSLTASGTTAAVSTSSSGILDGSRRRGEEGGDWFVPRKRPGGLHEADEARFSDAGHET